MRLLVVVLFVLGVKALKGDHSPLEEDAEQPKPLEKRLFKCGAYNFLKYDCCRGQLYVRKTHVCCPKTVEQKHSCGGKLYNPCTRGCCRNGGSAVVYSRFWKKCCSGKVEWKYFNKYCGGLVIHG